MEIGVSIPTIDIAVTSRIISAYKDERIQASKLYSEKKLQALKIQNYSSKKLEMPYIWLH